MDKKIPESWGLDMTALEKIYKVETAQAEKLRNASATERRELYALVYEEYFRQLPFHPQLTIKQNDTVKKERVDYQLRQVLPFTGKETTFMEIGAGDCSLSIAVSNYCQEVFALEVSKEITGKTKFPENIYLLIFDGIQIPLDANSVDVAYSNQTMEHLHPDDAGEQLKNIVRALKKGGVYICITPNRISGPHDISRFFTDKPVGFHLREYSATDLRQLFLRSGFSRVIAYVILKGRKTVIPFWMVWLVEKLAEVLPEKPRELFLKFRPVSIIFNSIIAGIK